MARTVVVSKAELLQIHGMEDDGAPLVDIDYIIIDSPDVSPKPVVSKPVSNPPRAEKDLCAQTGKKVA